MADAHFVRFNHILHSSGTRGCTSVFNSL